MDIKDILKQRRLELSLTMADVAKAVGVSEATVSRWESGNIADMKRSRIMALSDVLQISPSLIMGWDNEKENYFNGVLPIPKTKKVPLVGTIACGSPILAVENVEQDVDMPENIRADFALRCKGDSMVDAHIYDGDIVYIRKQPIVENGEVAAVVIEDEATLKRFYQDGDTVTLMPCNSKYRPFVYTGEQLEQIRIIGKAVGFTSTNI